MANARIFIFAHKMENNPCLFIQGLCGTCSSYGSSCDQSLHSY